MRAATFHHRAGLSLVEVVLAAAVLSIVLVGVLRALHQTSKEIVDTKMSAAVSEVEDVLAVNALKASWTYIRNLATSGGCNANVSNFANSMKLSPGGAFNTNLLGTTGRLTVLPETEAANAYGRCVASMTIAGTVPMSARSAFYYCLVLTPPVGTVSPYGAALANQPFFGEFTFSLRNLDGTPYTCNDFIASPAATPVGTLSYTLYWTARETDSSVIKRKSGTISFGNIPN